MKCTEQGILNRYSWMQGMESCLTSSPAALAQPHLQRPQQLCAQAEQRPCSTPAVAPLPLQHTQQPPLQHAAAAGGLVPMRPGHVVAFKTAVGFVDHLWELLAPFLSGADMLVVPEDVAVHPVPAPALAVASAAAPARARVPVPVPWLTRPLPPAGAAEPAATQPPPAGAVGSLGGVVGAATAETRAGTMTAGSNIVLQPDRLMRLLVDARATHLVSGVQGLVVGLAQKHSSSLHVIGHLLYFHKSLLDAGVSLGGGQHHGV